MFKNNSSVLNHTIKKQVKMSDVVPPLPMAPMKPKSTKVFEHKDTPRPMPGVLPVRRKLF